MDWNVIITTTIGTLTTIVLYLMKNKIENIEKRTDSVEKDVKEFKDNYLDRFEKVNNNINKSKIEILDRLHAIQMEQKNK